MLTNKDLEEKHNAILEFEKKKIEMYLGMIEKIERVKMDLQQEYIDKRINLLSEKKEIFTWINETLEDLRKERVNFQKKKVAEINEALKDSNVPDELVKEWLHLITALYNEDISVAQAIIKVDVEEFDRTMFDNLKELAKGNLESILTKHQSVQDDDINNNFDIPKSSGD